MNYELYFIVAVVLFAWSAWLLSRALPTQNIALILGVLIGCELALEIILHGRGFLRVNLLFWPAAIILSRVGMRWILRRWRKDWNYGVWLILLASATVAIVQFVFAPKLWATRFAATGVCLLFLSPWFISKFPQQPQDHAQ